MSRPAIQLYTLRSLQESVPDLIRRVGKTGLEGVEFAGLGDASADDIATALTETGLTPVAAHVGIEHLQESLEETVATYETIGCETLVVPMVDPSRFATPEDVAALADDLNAIAANLAGEAMSVGYHNHTFEFDRFADGRSAFEHLLAEVRDDVCIEFDCGLAWWGDADPVAFLEQHADRVDLVHLTDSIAGEEPHHRHYGTGDVALSDCAAAACAGEVDWCIYEHGQPDSPEHALEEAAVELPRLLDA